MDAFFASVEQRDNSKLRNKPIAVGGNPEGRGVVSTASYEARPYGVKSAISCRRAQTLCPNLIFVPVNMEKYKNASKEIHKIFSRYSCKIEPISIDEAFLDVTGKDPIEIGKSIKADITKELQLTASIGISYNKFLAKLASDMEKPNGFTCIRREEAFDILKDLPIRKLWGVGPRTEEQLNRLGIYKFIDMQEYDEEIIFKRLGKRGLELLNYARGIDERPVAYDLKAHSIGEENTFSKDIDDINILHSKLGEYSRDICQRIKANNYLLQTITVKIKYEDFASETRSITLKVPTDKEEVVEDMACFILMNKFNISKKVRLLGLTVSNFIYPNEPIQLQLDIDKIIGR